MKKKFLFLTFFIFILFNFSFANIKIEKYQLKNGLKIFLIPINRVNFVSFQIWYKVGSIDEGFAKSGISHLTEHLMFRGTYNVSNKDFDRIIKSNGGYNNAFTGFDYTAYYINLPSKKIEIPIKLESDRMQNLKMDKKEFKIEKEVVKEERRMRYEDKPMNYLWELVNAQAYVTHSYHWDAMSWMSCINNIKREDAYKWYKNHYQPKNAAIVVSGKFNKENVLNLIKKYFSSIKNTQKIKHNITKQLPQYGKRIVYLKKGKKSGLIFAYKAVNYKSRDAYALKILQYLLYEQKDSILDKRLVKKNLSIYVDGWYPIFSRDNHLFYIETELAKNTNYKTVKNIIENTIKEIKQGKLITKKDLQRAKNNLLADYIYNQDDLVNLGFTIGKIFTVTGNIKNYFQYEKKLQKITLKDIKKVARQYLKEDNLTIGILLPENNKTIRRRNK